MKNEQQKVSAIILENTSDKSLSECIDSILHQSFDNFEIIIVDDGKLEPSTSDIINSYASKDERVRVVTPKNKDNMFLRKEGLDAAQGDFVVFIDAVDKLEPSAFEKMYQNIKGNKSDIAVTDISFWDEKEQKMVEPDGSNFRTCFSSDTNFRNFTFTYKEIKPLALDRFICAWNKIYDISFLRNTVNHCFSVDEFYDTIPFQLQMILRAEKISFCPEKLYIYNIQEKETQTADELLENAHSIAFLDKVRKFREQEKQIEDYTIKFLEYTYSDFAFISLPGTAPHKDLLHTRVKNEFNDIMNSDDCEGNKAYTLKLYRYLISSATNQDPRQIAKMDKLMEKVSIIETSLELNTILLKEKEEAYNLQKAIMAEKDKIIVENFEKIADLEHILLRKTEGMLKLKQSLSYRIGKFMTKFIYFPVRVVKKIRAMFKKLGKSVKSRKLVEKTTIF